LHYIRDQDLLYALSLKVTSPSSSPRNPDDESGDSSEDMTNSYSDEALEDVEDLKKQSPHDEKVYVNRLVKDRLLAQLAERRAQKEREKEAESKEHRTCVRFSSEVLAEAVKPAADPRKLSRQLTPLKLDMVVRNNRIHRSRISPERTNNRKQQALCLSPRDKRYQPTVAPTAPQADEQTDKSATMRFYDQLSSGAQTVLVTPQQTQEVRPTAATRTAACTTETRTEASWTDRSGSSTCSQSESDGWINEGIPSTDSTEYDSENDWCEIMSGLHSLANDWSDVDGTSSPYSDDSGDWSADIAMEKERQEEEHRKKEERNQTGNEKPVETETSDTSWLKRTGNHCEQETSGSGQTSTDGDGDEDRPKHRGKTI